LGGIARLRPGRVAAIAAAIATFWAAPASAETAVSLTFDDGWADQLAGQPTLAEHDMNATYYIITGRVGNPGYFTWNELAPLYADSNEIGGHTTNHVDMTTETPEEARAAVCDARQQLLAQGYPQVSFAYPRGNFDATAQQIVKECGYTSGRAVSSIPAGEWPGAETIPPADPFAIRTPGSIDMNDSLSEIQDFITDAEAIDAANGGLGAWVPLVFHHICDPNINSACNDPNQIDGQYITPSDFDALLDWLAPRASIGTHVKTVAQVVPATQPPTSQVAFELRSIRSRRNGKAKIIFDVGGPGGLEAVDASVAGAAGVAAKRRRDRIRPTSKFVPQAGPVVVVILPSKAGKRILMRKGKLKVPVRVTFTPVAGAPVSQMVKVRLRLKRR
jgi:peptidoglycan/xylan/chitin deacetylase (PgdA/CDA1 family)